MEIAAVVKIKRTPGGYLVPSQTAPRVTSYHVQMLATGPRCNCPDFETRHLPCKHCFAVEYFMLREQNDDGTETVTETLTVSRTERKTYAQDWSNYNKAQVNEKPQFQKLLHSLCKGVDAPRAPRRGRPSLPLSDAVFGCVSKVYSTMSTRRFISDLSDAQDKGYVSKSCHYNSVCSYMEKPELYPVLHGMIEQSSLPLSAVETCFAVDSTGFTANKFDRWYDMKWGRHVAKQGWVKAHICTGVKTNIVTAVEILDKNAGDMQQLPPLVEATAKNFRMLEVSADKGYSGRASHDAIAAVGATPYIAFKQNTTGGVGGLFEKMWHYFQFNKEDFLAHYHKRSNVETTVSMVKAKFGDSVRSKTDAAQRNEVLCKLLAHNICCLISASYELGITMPQV